MLIYTTQELIFSLKAIKLHNHLKLFKLIYALCINVQKYKNFSKISPTILLYKNCGFL